MLNSNNLKVSIFITVRLSFGSQIAKKKKKNLDKKTALFATVNICFLFKTDYPYQDDFVLPINNKTKIKIR